MPPRKRFNVWSYDARSTRWMVVFENVPEDEALADVARKTSSAARFGIEGHWVVKPMGQEPTLIDRSRVTEAPVEEKAAAFDPTALPDGSVISFGVDLILIRNHPTKWSAWCATNGSNWSDDVLRAESKRSCAPVVQVLRRGWE
jgi:hypothetical protein